jgi:hypothetical protein
MDVYTGAAYDLQFGKGYVSYEEMATNYYTDVWNNGGSWWTPFYAA